jgi:glutamate decarboxylase
MPVTKPTTKHGSPSPLDSAFGSRAMQSVGPGTRFPAGEMRADVAYQMIHDELFLDGNARQNLATFCQTWDDEYVHRLMDESINKNWIDKEEYPQSAAIDLRCVNMVADLWNAPAPAGGQATGTNTIGSSEACMLGGMAMKWRWRARRKAQGKPTDRPNFVCGPVQVCWHKFARYWDVEIREIPMQPGNLFMDPARMIDACDENTIGVVPTFGVTYTGNFEQPLPLHDALDKLQKKKGLDIDMHVDAASGGFLAPFCAPDLVWDFRLPRIKSISASGHKYGLAPLGCGWVIWRDAAALPDDLVFKVDYLGGSVGTFAINFSRPAGQVISQYYEFLRLGRDGYAKVQGAAYEVAQFLAKAIAPLGPYEFIATGDPRTGIPAVCFRIKARATPGYTLYDLSERLRLRGWQVPAFALNGEAADVVVMRIMCRRGFEMDFASLLMQDFKAALAHLKAHPTLAGTAASGAFKHT